MHIAYLRIGELISEKKNLYCTGQVSQPRQCIISRVDKSKSMKRGIAFALNYVITVITIQLMSAVEKTVCGLSFVALHVSGTAQSAWKVC